MNTLRSIWLALRETLRERRRMLLALWSLTALAALALLPFDQQILGWMTRDWNARTGEFAHFLFKWGDASHGGVVVCGTLWLCGRRFRKPHWRTAALLGLCAGLISGVVANCFRWSVGRPRPRYSMEIQYFNPRTLAEYNRHGVWFPRRPHGPTLNSRFHSFPSAHATTSMAAAIPILLTAPTWGVPATAAALVVGWSRMYKLDHHPSDVLVGTALGITCGVLVVGIYRRREF